MAAAYEALHPEDFHAKFISAGIHARDGRPISRCRPTTLATGVVGTAVGSCLARVGSTAMVTGIKCQVGTPAEGAPRQGFLEVNVVMTPLCSSKFSVGRPPEEALALSQFLTRTVLRSGIFDVSQLCIAPGKAVWSLTADVVCLDHDGNTEDAALLSLCGALRTARLPKPTFNEDSGEVTVAAEETVGLKLVGTLVPLTCAVVSGQLVVDPTAKEERIAKAVFTTVLSTDGKVCGVLKRGNAAVEMDLLKASRALCRQRLEQLTSVFAGAAPAEGAGAGAGAGIASASK